MPKSTLLSAVSNFKYVLFFKAAALMLALALAAQPAGAAPFAFIDSVGGLFGLQSTGFENMAPRAARPAVNSFGGGPSFSIDDVTLAEGDAGVTSFTFTVTKTGVNAVESTVDFETVDGTAAAPADFTAFGVTTLTFPASVTTDTQQIIVFVNGDTTFENDEAFTVHLSNVVAATIADADGAGAITNDDAPPVFSIDNVPLNEGDGPGVTSFTFTVTKTGASDVASSVDYATSDGTAISPGDFTAVATTTLNFPASAIEDTQEVTVFVNGDTIFENNEAFTVDLSNAVAGDISKASVGTGTIVNDDGAPTFAIDDVTQAETNAGTTAFIFTITRTGASDVDATIDYTTQDGTATVADSDYVFNGGQANVSGSEKFTQVTVLVNGDTTLEPDETFTLHLVGTDIGTISDADGLGTITNDDLGPSVMTFSSPTYHEDESQTASINIHRSGDLSGISTVKFSTVPGGTAGGGVACGPASVDYVTVTDAIVTFNVGQADTPADVVVCGGDTLAEPPDTVNLLITADTGGTIGVQDTAVLTINDAASQYRNPASINLNNVGVPAALYPSPIVVAGAPTFVGSIRITLFDVSHFLPDNIDVLVQGPGGETYLLMADAGGAVSVSSADPVTLTFSDTSGTLLPDAALLTTGEYLPTTWEPGQSSFAGPAPAGPYTQAPSTVVRPNNLKMYGSFGLRDANGTWNLWVRDDNGSAFAPEGFAGQIAGGWGIEFLAPTNAVVDVSGRVLTFDGRGVQNARVTLTDSHGLTRTALSTPLGSYVFENVETGETYIIGVESKRYTFSQRLIQVFDAVTDADMVADQ